MFDVCSALPYAASQVMTVDGRALANYVLDYAESSVRPLTHLDLQKIIFFCHAWHLVKRGLPLVKEEFEAWQYGPVLQYLYREFRSAGDKPVRNRAKMLDRKNGTMITAFSDLDVETKAIVDEAIQFYGRLPTRKLVEISHAEGGPWYQVWNFEGKVNPGMRISHDSIKSFYSKSIPGIRLS